MATTMAKDVPSTIETYGAYSANTLRPLDNASNSFGDLRQRDPVAYVALTMRFRGLLNSGCTYHIICDCTLFHLYNLSQAMDVNTACAGTLSTLGMGEVHLCVTLPDNTPIRIILHECLHAPGAPTNLLSVDAMTENYFYFDFGHNECRVKLPLRCGEQKDPNRYFWAENQEGLFWLDCSFDKPPPRPPAVANLAAALPTFKKTLKTRYYWHCILGHTNYCKTN